MRGGRVSRIHHGFVVFVFRRQILKSRLLPVPAWSLDSEGLHSGWKTGLLEPYACVHVYACVCARVCMYTCVRAHMHLYTCEVSGPLAYSPPFCSKCHSPYTQLSEFLLSFRSLSFSLHWMFPYARSGDKTPFLSFETLWSLWYSSLRLVLRTLLVRGSLRMKDSVARASVGQSQSKIVYQKPQRVLQCEKKDCLNLIHYCSTYLVPTPHMRLLVHVEQCWPKGSFPSQRSLQKWETPENVQLFHSFRDTVIAFSMKLLREPHFVRLSRLPKRA